MTDIKIENLNISGSELFLDSESFLNELDIDELSVLGGLKARPNISTPSYHNCDDPVSTYSLHNC
jgi:hypothetical protein